jgi:molybdenum cofactor biosynthesis enzyme MoaA
MSLQVCVPGGCPNKCAFCVSRMHDQPAVKVGSDYLRRLQYARESGYKSVVLTGTGEPLTNVEFLSTFSSLNNSLDIPFRWIEIQTSGVGLRDRFVLLKGFGVSTIALSVADIFDDGINAETMGISKDNFYYLADLCHSIKEHGFNLRLSLNMWSTYNDKAPGSFFMKGTELGADQMTFKHLYDIDNGTPQSKWIQEHPYKDWKFLNWYILEEGRELEALSFGAIRYDVSDDCMGPSGPVNAKQIRYLILRPDGHLYTRWDSKGSLLF